MDLKARCQMTDSEWDERQKMRQEEITAISEAISILASDQAHDQFSKTFNPAASFLQLAGSQDTSMRRKAAQDIIAAVALKTKNDAMAALASSVQLDAFTK